MSHVRKLSRVGNSYPVPLDDDLLDRLFGDGVRAGAMVHPLDISHVWENSF